MISIIAKWSILPGKHDAAIAALRDLAERVRIQEPFVPMYTIHVPDFTLTSFPIPPQAEVIFFSVFDSREAFEIHLHGPVFRDWLAEHRDLFLFNGDNLFVVSEWLSRQAGFVRPSMVTCDPDAA
jgi:quinol monooxygenase YgiN